MKYKKGQWNVICDRNGKKYKSSEMKKEWNGFTVHKSEFEERQPQDFVRAKSDNQSVPWTRSESTDSETDTSEWADTLTSVPPGTNDGSL